MIEWYVFADGRSIIRVGEQRWSLRDISGHHIMYITEERIEYRDTLR